MDEHAFQQRMGKVSRDRRQHNRSLVPDGVRAQGLMSRACGMSMPAVMDIVAELIAEGLVQDVGTGPASGGRCPILLAFVPHAVCAIGMKVGCRTLTVLITDLRVTVYRRFQFPSAISQGSAALLSQVRALLNEVFTQHTIGVDGVLGIGLALPAPALSMSSPTTDLSNEPGWVGLRGEGLVAMERHISVLIEHEATAAADGERVSEARPGTHHLLYVLSERTVSGAVMVGGEQYRGRRGGVAMGHMLVDLHGPPCACGNCGGLDAFVGGDAIIERTRQALDLATRHNLGGQPRDQLTIDDVIAAGPAGDFVAQAVLRETGAYLGIAIGSQVNLLFPDLIIVGGTTMRAGALVVDAAQQAASDRTQHLGTACERDWRCRAGHSGVAHEAQISTPPRARASTPQQVHR